jgi:chaperonin cofactor prefoldin
MAQETDEQKIDRLTKKVEQLEKADKVKDKQLEDAATIVADLKQQLADKEAGVVKLPTFSVDKDTYELVGGSFTWAGKEVTVEDLKEDSKLAKELIKAGVTSLRKVEA